jgi:transcriptional regulator with GAF, ATPase, and Fis domain
LSITRGALISLNEVNCAIPSELIESELFGHVKGLLALCKDRAGKFGRQMRTTILDEWGYESSAQAKTRALQEV